MTGTTPPSEGDEILEYARLTRMGHHQAVSSHALEPRAALLRTWQSARLARTHADLIASPRYGPACRFFLSDVYAARDFSQRDHDILRVYQSVRLLLPASMRRALELVLVLNELTLRLDESLLNVLVDELGMDDTLTAEQYAEAYRRCDNYADRVRQIDLVVELGSEIDGLVRRYTVGMALRLARAPARLAGWHELQDFFERGFNAFKHMNGAGKFLDTLASRERQILGQIYAGAVDPFEVSS